jgi:23S rRNA U2552 (ribose-2'-O)-methylase RlmE/FtsJ
MPLPLPRLADRQLQPTRRNLGQLAQRDGQQLCLLGMAPGTGLLILLAFLAARVQIAGIDVQPLLIALTAGGIGAIVSVMTHLMLPSLPVDYHAGNS